MLLTFGGELGFQPFESLHEGIVQCAQTLIASSPPLAVDNWPYAACAGALETLHIAENIAQTEKGHASYKLTIEFVTTSLQSLQQRLSVLAPPQHTPCGSH